MDKALFAVAGTAAGLFLGWIKSYVDYLAQSKRELYVAALGCRDRLAKIDYALREVDDETRSRARADGWRPALANLAEGDWRRKTLDDELQSLGADLDRYREALAPIRSAKLREMHLRVYDDLTALLINHDLDQVDQLRNRLAGALGRMRFV